MSVNWVEFLICKLCAYSATYSGYDAKGKSCTLARERKALHRL